MKLDAERSGCFQCACHENTHSMEWSFLSYVSWSWLEQGSAVFNLSVMELVMARSVFFQFNSFFLTSAEQNGGGNERDYGCG